MSVLRVKMRDVMAGLYTVRTAVCTVRYSEEDECGGGGGCTADWVCERQVTGAVARVIARSGRPRTSGWWAVG